MFKKLLVFSFLFIIVFGFLNLNAINAADTKGTVLQDVSQNCISKGDCELNDFMKIAIGVTKIILGLTGSLALVAFIYGGVVMLISGGSSEKVSQAKSIIYGAVIGIVIVLASYTIIGFIFNALDIRDSTEQRVGSGWSVPSWFIDKK